MNQSGGIIDLRSMRAFEARLSKRVGKAGYQLLLISGLALLVAVILVTIFVKAQLGILLLAPALLCLLPAIWWKRRLSVLPADGHDLTGRLSVDILALLKPGMQLQPQAVWQAISGHWQARFMTHHLLLHDDLVAGHLGTSEAELQQALQTAAALADQHDSPVIELGHLATGLMAGSTPLGQYLTQIKLQPSDVLAVGNWLARNLADSHALKQNYGGIARDWAFGFTPLIDRFGMNVSQAIMQRGLHFGTLTESKGVSDIEAAFANHADAIALIGPEGIGKTNSVYALAQKLIEGTTVKDLAYHQIVALSATDIVSRARGPGELEQIMINLTNEAGHAGHIIFFLDDAQLFFTSGHGSFDATQILLSIIQARAMPMILAMSPQDYQRLKSQSPSLAGLLTPVILQEPDEITTMQVLEDSSVGLENRHKVLITYEAIREAYRLSGRYEQDEAYPGKAIKLLEQAVPHSLGSVVSAHSVQQAIEQTRGVKVSSAAPAEADQLLNLEDAIHRRMINQTHAVSVIANALRRARAGVTNPNRPIGSFLFLGPTGVGKTGLAKAVAAIYFGSEGHMVRLDMSEYQQPDDVQRLLSSGQNDNSLLLQIRQQPFAVVLLDETEKAHPNVLNLLLQLLDEGQLTDSSGRRASFKDCIIIATSNAGSQTIRDRVSRGESLESFNEILTDELINSGQFKPELINRFDELVLFRPLNETELAQVVLLMLNEVNKTLSNQNISVELTSAAIHTIVRQGNDPRLGARPMRRALQRAVENAVAQKILRGEAKPGDKLVLDVNDLAS